MAITGWWVADYLHRDPAILVSWVIWVIGSIVLHELAHGWAAIRLGDRTPIDTGHMTWNPLVHMGGFSLAMFALVGIAWGLMPINPSALRHPRGEAIVAASGPAMNLGLAIVAVVMTALWGTYAGGLSDPIYNGFETFFFTGALLNIVLLLLNLLPVPPLDGSRILADFSYRYREIISGPHASTITIVVLVLLFWSGFDIIWGVAGDLVNGGVGAINGVLP